MCESRILAENAIRAPLDYAISSAVFEDRCNALIVAILHMCIPSTHIKRLTKQTSASKYGVKIGFINTTATQECARYYGLIAELRRQSRDDSPLEITTLCDYLQILTMYATNLHRVQKDLQLTIYNINTKQSDEQIANNTINSFLHYAYQQAEGLTGNSKPSLLNKLAQKIMSSSSVEILATYATMPLLTPPASTHEIVIHHGTECEITPFEECEELVISSPTPAIVTSTVQTVEAVDVVMSTEQATYVAVTSSSGESTNLSCVAPIQTRHDELSSRELRIERLLLAVRPIRIKHQVTYLRHLYDAVSWLQKAVLDAALCVLRRLNRPWSRPRELIVPHAFRS